MKHKKRKSLAFSKVAIAKINLLTKESLKGGTLPGSDIQDTTALYSQCENEMCR